MTRLVALHAARALCSETAYSETAKPDNIVTKEKERKYRREKAKHHGVHEVSGEGTRSTSEVEREVV